MLHGQEYNQDQFKDLGLAQAADALAEQGRAMIIIMPKMPDYNTPVEQLTLEYFEKDLIPYIDETFRTLASKEARAVGGISRGANWAVRVGIEFPLLFGKIGLHSVALSNLESGALSARIGGLKPSRARNYISIWAVRMKTSSWVITLTTASINLPSRISGSWGQADTPMITGNATSRTTSIGIRRIGNSRLISAQNDAWTGFHYVIPVR